jgi:two-component system KDP operon response regulator KdpE
LTQREWSVLECLLEHQGRVVTSEQLLRRAWGPEFIGEKDHLKVVVNHLRQKLGDRARSSRYIHTERGLGYCFDPDLKAARPPT